MLLVTESKDTRDMAQLKILVSHVYSEGNQVAYYLQV